jgi:cell division transport system permease protein
VLVAKLVGATYSFIQRPFLYTGFWLGFLSGLLAWILVLIMVFVLRAPIEQLSVQYDGSFTMHYLSFTNTLLMLLISSVLGVMGAWIVLRYQVKQIQPE